MLKSPTLEWYAKAAKRFLMDLGFPKEKAIKLGIQIAENKSKEDKLKYLDNQK